MSLSGIGESQTAPPTVHGPGGRGLPQNDLHPDEAADVGDLLGLCGHLLAHLGKGGLDLAPVEVVGVELVLLPDVGGGVELDGGVAPAGVLAGRLGGRPGGGREGESGGGKLHREGRVLTFSERSGGRRYRSGSGGERMPRWEGEKGCWHGGPGIFIS